MSSKTITGIIMKMNPVALMITVIVIGLTANGIHGHYENDRAQDAKIAALQGQLATKGIAPEKDGITWYPTALSGASANNVVVQLEIRDNDGTTAISKIGITDSAGTAVSADWKAVSTPSPINSANSFIVWRNGDGSFHCKVQ